MFIAAKDRSGRTKRVGGHSKMRAAMNLMQIPVIVSNGGTEAKEACTAKSGSAVIQLTSSARSFVVQRKTPGKLKAPIWSQALRGSRLQ